MQSGRPAVSEVSPCCLSDRPAVSELSPCSQVGLLCLRLVPAVCEMDLLCPEVSTFCQVGLLCQIPAYLPVQTVDAVAVFSDFVRP